MQRRHAECGTQRAAQPERRVALAAFFVLAYALTWVCWLPLAADAGQTGGWLSAETLATLGQFGPFVAAVIVAGVSEGLGGLADLCRRLVRWRVSPLWYVVALFLPPALALAAIGVHAVRTGRDFVMGWPAVAENLVPHFLYILLVGGPLGEELGWRGFALPRLRAAFPPLLGTLLLAGAWACWHLPLWWVADVPCPFGLYFVGVVPLTYLFAWLTNRAGGSVFLAMLFHASVNTSLVRLPLREAFLEWTGLLWVAASVIYFLDQDGWRGRNLTGVSRPSSAGDGT